MFPRPIQNPLRAGFTLVELLLTIAIIAVMATFVLVALAGVTEKAREDRTKTQIAKINDLLMEKWESYLYRRMPPTSTMVLNVQRRLNQSGGDKAALSIGRLNSVREMMRMELPSHREDVLRSAVMLRDPLTNKPYEPALWRAYRARVSSAKVATGVDWTLQFEGAECLYLILSQMREADVSALEFFSESEIGDVDGDGMKEILDAWGTPIQWLRWAPGYRSPLQRSVNDEPEQDDMFDLAKVGHAYRRDFNPNQPRALYPLIFSAGPDGRYGISTGRRDESSDRVYSWYDAGNNPYDNDETRKMYLIGSTINPNDVADDITNHLVTTR